MTPDPAGPKVPRCPQCEGRGWIAEHGVTANCCCDEGMRRERAAADYREAAKQARHKSASRRFILSGGQMLPSPLDSASSLPQWVRWSEPDAAEVPPLERLNLRDAKVLAREMRRTIERGDGPKAVITFDALDVVEKLIAEVETLRAEGEARRRAEPVDDDAVIERTVAIMAQLHDLKEAVLHSSGFQPQFDAGLLDGALSILRANLPDDDPRVVAEQTRQMNSRLVRALSAAPLVRSSAPDTCTGQVHHGDDGATRCHCGAVSIREITFLHPGVRSGDGA